MPSEMAVPQGPRAPGSLDKETGSGKPALGRKIHRKITADAMGKLFGAPDHKFESPSLVFA
jgi:hypothetical protein